MRLVPLLLLLLVVGGCSRKQVSTPTVDVGNTVIGTGGHIYNEVYVLQGYNNTIQDSSYIYVVGNGMTVSNSTQVVAIGCSEETDGSTIIANYSGRQWILICNGKPAKWDWHDAVLPKKWKIDEVKP